MSLVNKMLRDLDARRAAPGERAALPSAVTPLVARQEPPRHQGVWLAGLLLVASAAATGWWLWSAAPQPAPVTTPSAATVATALPATPVVAAVAPAPTIVAPTDATPPLPQPVPAEPELRIDPDLAMLPAPRPAPQARPAVSKPQSAPLQPAASAPTAVPLRPVVAALPKDVAASPAAEPSINKQPRLPSAVERAEADYRRGQLAQRQGQQEEAAARYQAALAEHPEHAAARQSLAALKIEARRYDEAEALLRNGIALPAVRLASVLALARLQVERGQAAAALELLLANAAAGERSADYQGFAAALLNRAGRQREAAERYQAATHLAPNDGRWWVGLGIVLDAEGKT
ncbi:MAG: tetratricopeptide repeat protein, partial [Sulfuritalea sp.]|nr:tetratricopeptide repeat protein [Sulfuritalea sp.]